MVLILKTRTGPVRINKFQALIFFTFTWVYMADVFPDPIIIFLPRT